MRLHVIICSTDRRTLRRTSQTNRKHPKSSQQSRDVTNRHDAKERISTEV